METTTDGMYYVMLSNCGLTEIKATLSVREVPIATSENRLTILAARTSSQLCKKGNFGSRKEAFCV